MIRLKPLQRILDLPGGGLPGPPVDLGHEEHLLPVAVAQRLAHAHLAAAVMVIPAIVHEGDAPVDCAPDEADALLLILLCADVIASQPDGRNLFARPSQPAVKHSTLGSPRQDWNCRPQRAGGARRRHEFPPRHTLCLMDIHVCTGLHCVASVHCVFLPQLTISRYTERPPLSGPPALAGSAPALPGGIL